MPSSRQTSIVPIVFGSIGREGMKIACLIRTKGEQLLLDQAASGVGELLARVQADARRASWADTPRSVGTSVSEISVDF